MKFRIKRRNPTQESRNHKRREVRLKIKRANREEKEDLLDITVGICIAKRICHSMWKIRQNATTRSDHSAALRSSYTATKSTVTSGPPQSFLSLSFSKTHYWQTKTKFRSSLPLVLPQKPCRSVTPSKPKS